MERCRDKSIDKGKLFQVGDSSPSNCIRRQVENEQPVCVCVCVCVCLLSMDSREAGWGLVGGPVLRA